MAFDSDPGLRTQGVANNMAGTIRSDRPSVADRCLANAAHMEREAEACKDPERHADCLQIAICWRWLAER